MTDFGLACETQEDPFRHFVGKSCETYKQTSVVLVFFALKLKYVSRLLIVKTGSNWVSQPRSHAWDKASVAHRHSFSPSCEREEYVTVLGMNRQCHKLAPKLSKLGSNKKG